MSYEEDPKQVKVPLWTTQEVGGLVCWLASGYVWYEVPDGLKKAECGTSVPISRYTLRAVNKAAERHEEEQKLAEAPKPGELDLPFD